LCDICTWYLSIAVSSAVEADDAHKNTHTYHVYLRRYRKTSSIALR
jgi:hypothetical protein